MHLTLAQKEGRRNKQAMLDALRGGMGFAEAASKFGYEMNTVKAYASRAGLRAPFIPEAQARQKQAAAAHKAWRKKHILRCKDYPEGGCCPQCHAPDNLMLEIFDLPGDMHAYVCCQIILANALALGYKNPRAAQQVIDSFGKGYARSKRGSS